LVGLCLSRGAFLGEAFLADPSASSSKSSEYFSELKDD